MRISSLRTISLLLSTFALLLLSSPRAGAQCTDLGGGCSRAIASCEGSTRICCPFGFGASNLDPRAMGTFFLVGACANRPLPLPAGVSCSVFPTSRCTLLVDPSSAFLAPVPVGPSGGALVRGTVPCDPAVVGQSFCFQVLQVRGAAGRACLDVSNAVMVAFEGRGLCR